MKRSRWLLSLALALLVAACAVMTGMAEESAGTGLKQDVLMLLPPYLSYDKA